MPTKKPKRKEQKRAVITLRVPPELHKRLRVAAAHHDMTIQDLVLNGAKVVLGDGQVF